MQSSSLSTIGSITELPHTTQCTFDTLNACGSLFYLYSKSRTPKIPTRQAFKTMSIAYMLSRIQSLLVPLVQSRSGTSGSPKSGKPSGATPFILGAILACLWQQHRRYSMHRCPNSCSYHVIVPYSYLPFLVAMLYLSILPSLSSQLLLLMIA